SVGLTDRPPTTVDRAPYSASTAAIRAADRRVAQRRRGRGWLMRRLLVAADVVGLAIAFLVTELLYGNHGENAVGLTTELSLFFAALPVWLVGAKLFGLY